MEARAGDRPPQTARSAFGSTVTLDYIDQVDKSDPTLHQTIHTFSNLAIKKELMIDLLHFTYFREFWHLVEKKEGIVAFAWLQIPLDCINLISDYHFAISVWLQDQDHSLQ